MKPVREEDLVPVETRCEKCGMLLRFCAPSSRADLKIQCWGCYVASHTVTTAGSPKRNYAW